MDNLKKTLEQCYEAQERLLAACLEEEEISEAVQQEELDRFRADYMDDIDSLDYMDSHYDRRSIREGSLDDLLLNGDGFSNSEEYDLEN